MDLIAALEIVSSEWETMGVVFTLGAAWWQGKHWFARVSTNLKKIIEQDAKQANEIGDISHRLEQIELKLSTIDSKVDHLTEEVQEQEIQIAVLKSRTEMSLQSRSSGTGH